MINAQFITRYFKLQTAFLLQYMRHGGCIKRPFPITTNPPDGTVGEESFHSHSAKVALHEAAAIQVRHYEASPFKLCN